MRAVGAGDAAQPQIVGALSDWFKIEVANSSDVLVDFTDEVRAVEYESGTDEIVDAATVTFLRGEGASSLAPLMTADPPIAIGRRIVISHDPGDGFREIFRGQIDDVDWPERFGDVIVKCRDQAGIAADTWIEEAVAYSTTSGVVLETAMQKLVDNTLDDAPTLYVPVATSAVLIHTAGDGPYTPTDQYVLDALRAMAESFGGVIRWRHFDGTADDWRWTVFSPERSKVVPDHTFGPDDYWDVTEINQSTRDIRNVIKVVYPTTGGAMAETTTSDNASIALYGRRYGVITEPSNSPVNNGTLAGNMAAAALSDLKDPDALLEIKCPYFWPGEIGVDLYRFTANEKHFTDDQDLAAMSFRHRIAVGEIPTTWIRTRGKPSGGVLMWRRRIRGDRLPTSLTADMAITNVREVARTETGVTLGWDLSGSIDEVWVYTSTPAQPLASDPYAGMTGTPTTRLTGDSVSHTIAIPDPGLVTYVLIYAIGVRGATIQRSNPADVTIQGNLIKLIQQATISTPTAIGGTIVVKVANPLAGGNITVTPTAVGVTISPTGAQTIASGDVTTDIGTTGNVQWAYTRADYGSGVGRVTFVATSTDRVADVDAVEIPAKDTVELQVRSTVTSTTATQVVVRVAVADVVSGPGSGDISIAYTSSTGTSVSPASPQTIASASVTTSLATTGTVDFTITRPSFQTGTGRVTFTASRTGRVSVVDAVDVPAQERDTVASITRIERVSETSTQIVVRVMTIIPTWTGSDDGTIEVTYNAGGLTVSPASGGTFTAEDDWASTGYIDYTITRPAQGSNPSRVTFTCTPTGMAATDSTDSVDVLPQFDRFRARVRKSGDQSLTTLTPAFITFDTEDADNGGMHDTGSNTHRLTIPAGGNVGFWLLQGHVFLTGGGAPDTSVFSLGLENNAGTTLDTDRFEPYNGNSGVMYLKVSAMVVAPTAGNWYALRLTPTFASGSPVITSGVLTFFEAIHVF